MILNYYYSGLESRGLKSPWQLTSFSCQQRSVPPESSHVLALTEITGIWIPKPPQSLLIPDCLIFYPVYSSLAQCGFIPGAISPVIFINMGVGYCLALSIYLSNVAASPSLLFLRDPLSLKSLYGYLPLELACTWSSNPPG